MEILVAVVGVLRLWGWGSPPHTSFASRELLGLLRARIDSNGGQRVRMSFGAGGRPLKCVSFPTSSR